MAREPRRVLTVEEARNLPPPTDEELAAARRALDHAHGLAEENERRLGRPLTLEDILWALGRDDDTDAESEGRAK